MHPLVSLAKSAVEKYIKENVIITPPEELLGDFGEERKGVFVTINKNEELRGCIGTASPTKSNILEEIIQNSIASSTEDHRFGKIKKEELDSLSYEVSILEKPELVEDVSLLDPQKYGIIVETEESPFKKALLLPDLEGIETPEEQISIASQKAGIETENTRIYKFEVKKFE